MYDNDELVKTKQRLYKAKDDLDKAKQEIFKLKQEIKELQMGIIHKLPEGMNFSKLFRFCVQYFSQATGVNEVNLFVVKNIIYPFILFSGIHFVMVFKTICHDFFFFYLLLTSNTVSLRLLF